MLFCKQANSEEIEKSGMGTMRNRLLIVGALVLGVASVAFGTDYAIVVNPANPARAMSLVELAKIFKAKTTIWPDGKGITLVLRDPTSPGTKFILEKVLGGTFDEEKAVLSDPGRKSAVPVVFAESDEEVMRIVGGNAGAIGVIDVYNITGGVKVIKIDDKQPFDPGYVLKGR
jgi:ABC-type phosphate transport system substrate-binding protein